jgi:hypothetical protein
MATSSVAYNKPVLPRVSDTSDLASNRASVYSGKALDFDGVNDSVLVNNFSFNPLSSDFTFSTYVRVDELKDGKIAYAEKGSNDSQLAVWQVRTDLNGDLYFQSNTDTWYTINWSGFSTEIKDRVVHLTFVRVGTSVNLYLNGKLYGEGFGSIPTTLSSANGRFCIGNRLGASNYLNGIISDYKIFDVALTAAQVAELYNNPEQILPTGVAAANLKLWLPMMEGAGSYVYNGAAGSLGEELVSNGTVDEVCQKWAFTDNGYLTATGGKLVWNVPNGSGSTAVQYLDIQANKTYRVTFDYSLNRDGFSVILGNANNASAAVVTGTGTYTIDLTPTSTNDGLFSLNMSAGTGDLTGYMDNISVKEVVPQATGTISGATWVAGVGEPVPQTALIDWNKHQQFVTQSSSVRFNSSGTYNNGTFILKHIPLEVTTNRYFVGYGENQGQRNRNLGQYGGYYWFVGWGSGAQDETLTGATVDVGRLTTMAYSWDSSYKIKAYKNGAKVFDGTKTLSAVTATNVYLNDRGDATSSSTATDNIAVYLAMYNRVLSEEEINDVYNGVVSPDSVSGCVHYWENSRSWVDLVGSVNGSYVGSDVSVLNPEGLTASKDIFGGDIVKPRSAGAFNFDRASWAYIQENASHKLSSANDITYEGWFRFTPDGLAGGRPVFGKRWQQSAWLRFYYIDTTESFYFEGSSPYGSPGTSISPNTWYHMVGVASGGNTLTLYKDGVLITTVSAGYTIDFAGEFEIGIWSSENKLNGQLANIRVYNYALTPNQVADNFNQKASTFGKTKVVGELQAYINRTVAAGATVEAHSALLNTLTELENK